MARRKAGDQTAAISDLDRHIAKSMLNYALGGIGDNRSEATRSKVPEMTDAEMRTEAEALVEHPTVGRGARMALNALDGHR